MTKILFLDFWPNFNKKDNFFTRNLFDFPFEVVDDSDNGVDLIIYSCFGDQHRYYGGGQYKKIYFNGENMDQDYYADLCLTHRFDDGNNLWLPMFVLGYYGNDIHTFPGTLGIKDKSILFKKKEYQPRDKFCSFIYSSADMSKEGVAYRIKLFAYLNSKQQVESAGSVLNNVGWNFTDKIEALKKYKFSFCIENSFTNGYLTEKLIDGMLGGTIPIYLGGLLPEQINKKSLIDGRDFKSIKELGHYILWLDDNEDEYRKIYEQPYMIDQSFFDLTKIKQRIKNLINNK